jgi:hypothetical protein
MANDNKNGGKVVYDLLIRGIFLAVITTLLSVIVWMGEGRLEAHARDLISLDKKKVDKEVYEVQQARMEEKLDEAKEDREELKENDKQLKAILNEILRKID